MYQNYKMYLTRLYKTKAISFKESLVQKPKITIHSKLFNWVICFMLSYLVSAVQCFESLFYIFQIFIWKYFKPAMATTLSCRSWFVCLLISFISSISLRACCFHRKSSDDAISTFSIIINIIISIIFSIKSS